MIDDNDRTMSSRPGPAPQQARRRLLRGSFAAPTVLAISSGSALAASSALRCFNNAPAGVDAPPENFFRVQRYSIKESGTTIKVVKASDIMSLAILWGFDGAWYTSGKTLIDIRYGNDVKENGTLAADSGAFVSLRFDNVGTDTLPSFRVTGLAESSTVYSGSGSAKVMTGSCWSSFKTAPT